MQTAASVTFEAAGGLIMYLVWEARSERPTRLSLSVAASLYSVAYAALSASFYAFTWLLWRASQKQASSQIQQLNEVDK